MLVTHVENLIADNREGIMKLQAYKCYVPLFALADHLGLDNLCRNIVGHLFNIHNRKLIALLQRIAIKTRSVGDDYPIEQHFKDDFVRLANQAYAVPESGSREGGGGHSVRIRGVFVDLFMQTRFHLMFAFEHKTLAEDMQPLFGELGWAMISNGLGHFEHEPCCQCGIDPLEDVKDHEGTQTASNGTDEGGDLNFWAGDKMCMKCLKKMDSVMTDLFGSL